MIPAPTDDQIESDSGTDRQANAMREQLRNDVASWATARSGEAADPAMTPVASGARQTSKPVAARPTRQKAKPAKAAIPVETEKKPFRMSYDGTTDRDYIAHRIKYGAR